MEWLNQALDFLQTVFLLTLNQLISIFGFFFIFGVILYFLSRFTRNTFVKTTGRTIDIIVTGWLGTIVHELGHALFCILFLHRIVKIKLYDPDPADGSLGYVMHTYNRRNLYQRIGNFFIGIGPIIFGSMVLYAALYYFLPNKQQVLGILSSGSLQIESFRHIFLQSEDILHTAFAMVNAIFARDNLDQVFFWVFLYISICVASHMELSIPDMKGMWSGLWVMIVLLLVVNGVALLFHFNASTYIMKAHAYTRLFDSLFIYAIVISFLNFAVSWIVLNIYALVRYRRIVNPFY